MQAKKAQAKKTQAKSTAKATKKPARKTASKPAKKTAKAKEAVKKNPVKKTIAKKTAATKAAVNTAPDAAPETMPAPQQPGPHADLMARVISSLEDDKAQDIVSIELAGRSSLCDAVVVASGTSSRHVASTAEHLVRRLKDAGYAAPKVEGVSQGDWVLVDTGDVIVHLFRPEVRSYYDIESMWSVDENKNSPSGAAA